MKKLILALILFATPAQALTCEEIADTCGAVMSARQNGSPMSDILMIAYQYDPAVAGPVIEIVQAAYAIPVKDSEHSRRAAEIDFKDSCLRICQGEL